MRLVMKKKFNILSFQLCLDVSFSVLPIKEHAGITTEKKNANTKINKYKKKNKSKLSKDTYKSEDTLKNNLNMYNTSTTDTNVSKHESNVQSSDYNDSYKNTSDSLGVIGTVEHINNSISVLATKAANSNLSFRYSAWYTDDTDYLLDGIVEYDCNTDAFSFSGYMCKGANENRTDVSFSKTYGGGLRVMVWNDNFVDVLNVIIKKCELFTGSSITSCIQSYFKCMLSDDKINFEDKTNTYYIDKCDKSLITVQFSLSSNLIVARRFIEDNFIDQIEDFKFEVVI